MLSSQLLRWFGFFGLVLLLACSGSKAYYKKGEKLNEAGLYKEAAEYYLIALRKNPNNVDAKIGLKSNGERLLEDKLTRFYKAHGAENYREAVYAYQDAMDYHATLTKYIDVEVAPYYEGYYNEAKDAYLKQRYADSQALLKEEKFEAAQEVLDEILEIDPHYEDARILSKSSEVEPMYRMGIESFEAEKYREAYNLFDQVIEMSNAYKDALDYRKRALNKASVTVAVLPFESDAKEAKSAVIEKLYSKVLTSVLQVESPFLTVIDRKHTSKIIEEQKLALSGLVDEATAAKAGKLMGAKVVITGKLLSYTATPGKLVRERRKGWEQYTQRMYNRVGGYYYNAKKYNKVYYDVYSGTSKAACSFQFAMISSETGEVLASDVIYAEENDLVEFATFDGNFRNLYQGDWASKTSDNANDKVYVSVSDKQKIDRLFTTNKKELKSPDEMRISLFDQVADKVAAKVQAYEKEQS